MRGIDGMGQGDFKLLAAIGAWVGVANLLIVVLMASVIGIVAALVKRVAKSQPMAFGPCLANCWLVCFSFSSTSYNGNYVVVA